MLFFWPNLQPTTWNNLKKSYETPTSVEINFLHKIENTTTTSCLWAWPYERHGYSLHCTKYCFYGPNQPILTDAGRGKACL